MKFVGVLPFWVSDGVEAREDSDSAMGMGVFRSPAQNLRPAKHCPDAPFKEK